MVAGVVFPQNSDSVPFRFSLDYHNTTTPGDRSYHAPVPKHAIIDRYKDDNKDDNKTTTRRQRILHPPVRQRTVLPLDAPHPGVLTETDSRTENSRMYDTDTKAPAS